MAKYDIKGSCGHYFTKNLTGHQSSRESYIEWATDRLECPDCYKVRLEKERKEASELAAQQAASENLPTLTGSEKQIRWAESIRIKKLESLRKIAGENADNEEMVEKIKFFVERVKTKTEAKWFIDIKDASYSRDYFLIKIVEDKAKESGKNLVG